MAVSFQPLSVSEAVGTMEIPSRYLEDENGFRIRIRRGTRSLVIRPGLGTELDWLIWEGFTAIQGKVQDGGSIEA